MTPTYRDFRKAGWLASHALYAAKAVRDFKVEEWDDVTDEGNVRLRAEPEEEGYFDVYGEPEGYTDIHGRNVTAEEERRQICDEIDRNGCWWIVAEWRDPEGTWHHADSVGMYVYSDPLSPVENCYVPDLMRSAVEALNVEKDAAEHYAKSC